MGDPRVRRFLQLLVNRGFVEESLININGSQKKLFRFGPLGSLLRRNILKQWWDAVVLEQPNAFCVENTPLVPVDELLMPDKTSEKLHLLKGTSLRSSLSHDCSAAYLSALKLTNGQLPVSVASSGQCFHGTADEIGSNADGDKLLKNGLSETQLLLQNYSPPVNVAQVFDYWLRSRLRWWRQFSSNPSKFNSSTSSDSKSKTSEESSSQAAINYSFPWGAEAVETICNHGDIAVRQLEATSGVSHQGKYHQKTFYPHLIECQTSIEQCMAVFLTDAYREHEVKRKGATKNQEDVRLALHLHPLLSPYQVTMSVTGSRLREVRVLAEHVAKELRDAGISVFTSPPNSDSMESQYRRNDELGVPYTVVMSDQTLDTGVITVRGRDTRLKQQQHVSKLQSILLQSIGAQDLT
ncbi:DNA polymerase subunit gamma-2, mitochondrial-like isoform X2 [Littorina saxatilis]|uniref:Anticodon-binding domain-containing protein n=2 Tax=Littorina saxatilis TaxID=31220 RepID=A0AAN9BVC6_9CAEN